MVRASRIGLLVAAALASSAAAADARTLHGIVYADANGNGLQDPDEVGVPGAVVAYDISVFVVADDTGQFDLAIPDGGSDNAWVRVPDGYAPGPVWENVAAASTLSFGVRPVAAQPGPLTFVVASDAHITQAQPFFDDVTGAALRATALVPPPAFFAITGDVTQNDYDADYDLMDEQTADLSVPFVPIPGNHDWYDGGTEWHLRYGPDNYSFDAHGVHFVVWNMASRRRHHRVPHRRARARRSRDDDRRDEPRAAGSGDDRDAAAARRALRADRPHAHEPRDRSRRADRAQQRAVPHGRARLHARGLSRDHDRRRRPERVSPRGPRSAVPRARRPGRGAVRVARWWRPARRRRDRRERDRGDRELRLRTGAAGDRDRRLDVPRVDPGAGGRQSRS